VGHSKDVLSVAFSADNRQIVSGSRDKTIKLWNTLVKRRKRSCDSSRSHSGSGFDCGCLTRDGMAVMLFPQGECKFTITDRGHSEWVSCVRFSPSPTAPVIVSCGWDKKVKVREEEEEERKG